MPVVCPYWMGAVHLRLRGKSPSAIASFALTLVAYAIAVIEVPSTGSDSAHFAAAVTPRIVLVFLAFLGGLMFAAVRASAFRYALAAHGALTWTFLLLFTVPPDFAYLLALSNVVPIAAYERFPLNLVLCAALGVPTGAIFWWHYQPELLQLLAFGVVMTGVGMAGSLLTHYREATLRQQKYINRLEDNVSSLTRANFLSQDYARGVEEQSREAERLKLTRDIHDVVGYTLTNNMMIMEAVKVMARTEPARVRDYVESLRRNTEAGLAEIRRILADFRNQPYTRETLHWALVKLVRVFTMSTSVQVRYEFGNANWRLLQRYAECVYHFIQEGLINAFRHGRCSEVVIFLWDYGKEVRISISDNGVGSRDGSSEGIGIRGMRERAQAAGGRVLIDAAASGFRISMVLPLRDREGTIVAAED